MTQLKNKAVGDIVKLNHDGVAWEYIIGHRGSPSAMYNGFDGGVLVFMKNTYESRPWNDGAQNNDYAFSTINKWLNNTFLYTLDEDIRPHVKPVRIPYRAGSGTSTTVSSGDNGLLTQVFFLSGREVGFGAATYLPNEGVAIDYFKGIESTGSSPIRMAKGVSNLWWLRSSHTSSSTHAWVVFSDGHGDRSNGTSDGWGIRPAFVLPEDLMVADDGTIVANAPPVISGTDTDLSDQAQGFTHEFTATDPDGDEVSVSATLDGTSVNVVGGGY
jgi:hypothetical protein